MTEPGDDVGVKAAMPDAGPVSAPEGPASIAGGGPSSIGEGFAFFCWHRHRWPLMLGDTACQSSGDHRSFCRKLFDRRWRYRT